MSFTVTAYMYQCCGFWPSRSSQSDKDIWGKEREGNHCISPKFAQHFGARSPTRYASLSMSLQRCYLLYFLCQLFLMCARRTARSMGLNLIPLLSPLRQYTWMTEPAVLPDDPAAHTDDRVDDLVDDPVVLPDDPAAHTDDRVDDLVDDPVVLPDDPAAYTDDRVDDLVDDPVVLLDDPAAHTDDRVDDLAVLSYNPAAYSDEPSNDAVNDLVVGHSEEVGSESSNRGRKVAHAFMCTNVYT